MPLARRAKTKTKIRSREPPTKRLPSCSSHDPPLPAQQPLGKAQQQQHEKDDRHIPQFLGVTDRDARLRIGDLAREPVQVLRPPVPPARLRSQLFEQLAILFGMKI